MTIAPSLEALASVWTPEEIAEFQQLAAVKAQSQVFYPTPRQLQVLSNKADIIGYGGAAGGGKSYLLTGVSTIGLRTAIIRPQKNQTKKFVQELCWQ